MKRQQDRGTPPKGKRPRPGYDEYDYDDRMSPDVDRRDSRAPMSMMGRERRVADRDRFDDEFERMPKRQSRTMNDRSIDETYYNSVPRQAAAGGVVGPEYRTLCVSQLNSRVHDTAVKDKLYAEFQKFGDFNVKVVHNGDQRLAYVNFKYPQDAKDAKRSRMGKLVLFDAPARIDPVYNKRDGRQRSLSPDEYSGGGGSGGGGGGGGGGARDLYSNHSLSPPPPPRRSMGGSSGGGGGGGGGGGAGGGNGRRPMGRDERDMPPKDRGDFRGSFNDSGPGIRGGGNQEHHRREPKFPHHLNHIPPEDDEKATRTLFIGNLDYNITDPDIRNVFERYGVVEDIDIKRPHHGQGNAYAFIRFYHLDMAHRAKVDMSGKLIGKFQCKIGYGKPTPSTALWLGGLGPWTSMETLEREFDRFGVVQRIHWPQDKHFAYVLYDSIDAAQAACQEMRGFNMGGPEHRLKIDFADPEQLDSPLPDTPAPRASHDSADNRGDFSGGGGGGGGGGGSGGGGAGGRDRDQWQQGRTEGGSRSGRSDWQRPRNDSYRSDENNARERPGRDSFNDGSNGQDRRRGGEGRNYEDGYRTQDRERFGRRDDDRGNFSHDRPRRTSPGGNSLPGHYDGPRGEHNDDRNRDSHMYMGLGNLETVGNVTDMAKCLPVVWSGALVLKASAFAARLHLVSGDVHLVDTLMRDTTSTEMPVLKITQRLRLDQPKLDEVGRRVASSGASGHSVLLAMPGSAPADDPNSSVQQRPLKNLISYLKQKEAAGVISLPPNPGKDRESGVLHAFPPCQFGEEFLRKRAPCMSGDLTKDDHLVVIVYRGVA